MKKKLCLKNKLTKLFIICFFIGVIIAISFYLSLKEIDIKTLIKTIKNNNILFQINNNAFDHLKILSVVLLLSLIYIGFFIFLGILISEGFKITFRIIILYKSYKINGFIYAFIYTLINNIFYIIMLMFILKKLVKIIKIISRHKFKNEPINYSYLYNVILSIVYLLLIIFIYDLLIYIYGNKVLYYFKSICKI